MSEYSGSPRKRARTESSASGAPICPASPVHDLFYYKETGDFVVQIHKERLTSDNSAFQDLFKLPPTHENATAGASDSNPVICVDDPEQFRALCWALYAVPTALKAQEGPEADLSLLISLAFIANKYNFTSYERWSLDTLVSHVKTRGEAFDTDTICHMADAASICGRTDLIELLVPAWISSSKDGSGSIIGVLEACERHGLKHSQSLLYLAKVRQLQALAPTSQGTLPFAHLGLDGVHFHRLLVGFTSLAQLAARSKSERTVPIFSHNCKRPRHCTQMWHLFWSQIYHRASGNDVEPTIQYDYIQIWMNEDPTFSGFYSNNHSCKQAVIQRSQELRKETIDGLHNHFFAMDG